MELRNVVKAKARSKGTTYHVLFMESPPTTGCKMFLEQFNNDKARGKSLASTNGTLCVTLNVGLEVRERKASMFLVARPMVELIGNRQCALANGRHGKYEVDIDWGN